MDNSRPLFSVVIPYCNRLPYIERVLEALADQDVGFEQFEIVIGCLEYSSGLVRILESLPEAMRVRCIMVREPWKVSRARNLAFAHSEGEVLVLLDSDMLLPQSFLRKLRDNHNLLNEDYVLIAQMLNYSAYTDVLEENLTTYDSYRERYLRCDRRDGLGVDVRWTRERRIPWSLCWTALMAVPRRLVERYSLYFDPQFSGWGAEDLEWGYRIERSAIEIRFANDLWGIHIPHKRDVSKNCAEQELNYDRFLRKWPCFEVEIVTRFGDAFANQHYDELRAAWEGARSGGKAVNVVEFSVGGLRHLALGAISDPAGQLLNCREVSNISRARITSSVPLLGLRLPYPNRSVHCTYLLKSLRNLPTALLEHVFSETRRISGEIFQL